MLTGAPGTLVNGTIPSTRANVRVIWKVIF